MERWRCGEQAGAPFWSPKMFSFFVLWSPSRMSTVRSPGTCVYICRWDFLLIPGMGHLLSAMGYLDNYNIIHGTNKISSFKIKLLLCS